MENFPLYDTLFKDLPKKDLSLKQKKDFLSKIENLDPKGTELVYVLIRSFQINELKENPKLSIPFGGKVDGNEITLNLSKMPINLRQLLYKFLCIHFQAMEEKLDNK